MQIYPDGTILMGEEIWQQRAYKLFVSSFWGLVSIKSSLWDRVSIRLSYSLELRCIWAKKLSLNGCYLARKGWLQQYFEQGNRRGQAAAVSGYQERQGRKVLQRLLAAGLLVSDTPKGAVRVGFPSSLLDRYFPRLFLGWGWSRSIFHLHQCSKDR